MSVVLPDPRNMYHPLCYANGKPVSVGNQDTSANTLYGNTQQFVPGASPSGNVVAQVTKP